MMVRNCRALVYIRRRQRTNRAGLGDRKLCSVPIGQITRALIGLLSENLDPPHSSDQAPFESSADTQIRAQIPHRKLEEKKNEIDQKKNNNKKTFVTHRDHFERHSRTFHFQKPLDKSHSHSPHRPIRARPRRRLDFFFSRSSLIFKLSVYNERREKKSEVNQTK